VHLPSAALSPGPAVLSLERSRRGDGHELTHSETSAWLSGVRYPRTDGATGEASLCLSGDWTLAQTRVLDLFEPGKHLGDGVVDVGEHAVVVVAGERDVF
jgi:hypothetical protein